MGDPGRFPLRRRAVGHPALRRHPGRFSYTFYPALDDARRGIGPTRDYWVSAISPRRRTGGTLAAVTAATGARPERSVSLHDRTKPVVDLQDAEQSVETTQSWSRGSAPRATSSIALKLVDIRALRVNLVGAGFGHRHGVVTVTTDGPTTLRLSDGRRAHLSAGRHRVRF